MIARVAVLCLLAFSGRLASAEIKTDETILFFPSMGSRVEDGAAWELDVRGWIYEPEPRGVALAVLRRALGLRNERDTAEREIFAQRARAFLTDNERGKRIKIQLGGRTYELGATGANGHFSGRLRVTADHMRALRESSGDENDISFRAVLGPGDPRAFAGRISLVEPVGLTVISDIDDTIKVTEVVDRHAMLRNTFLKPFEAVPGMAPVYQGWATNESARFHYVTASPWQLYVPLSEFIRSNGFPGGTFHMKTFRWKDETFLDLFKSPEKYKLAVIEPILDRFPRRRFVLVGDSGERDPEIFARLARRRPKQVTRILIRDVTGEGADSGRYRKAFAGLPRGTWQIFSEAREIRDALPRSE